MAYFGDKNPDADFVVHEIAHLFHNNRRQSIGLPETRKRKYLLDIDYRKRESFAYACEAYSRIRAIARNRTKRVELFTELKDEPTPADDRVDGDEYLEILGEAVVARNGWKHILRCCAPGSASPR